MWWWFIGVLIFIALIWIITHQIQSGKKKQNPYPRSVEETLNDDYQRGEISEEEYESKQSKLKKQDEANERTNLDDPTAVKNTLNSRSNPDTPLADAEKPPRK